MKRRRKTTNRTASISKPPKPGLDSAPVRGRRFGVSKCECVYPVVSAGRYVRVCESARCKRDARLVISIHVCLVIFSALSRYLIESRYLHGYLNIALRSINNRLSPRFSGACEMEGGDSRQATCRVFPGCVVDTAHIALPASSPEMVHTNTHTSTPTHASTAYSNEKR